MRLYHPVVDLVLRFRRTTIAIAVLAVVATVPVFLRLGSEFMPPLNEGTLLYMPTALPGMSITQARAAIQTQDRALMQFPEVAHVFGKAGRAESPTDPAPVNMFETIVTLKPEAEWRPGMTWDRLVGEMDRAIRYPGMPNIWWMPIQTRTEMLATGIRSVLGVKVFGPDLVEIGRIATAIEQTLATLPGTRSAFAERTTGAYYLDLTVKRDAVGRYGMTVGDVQDVIESAIGGTAVSQTVEGRERYSIAVRYPRDERSDPDALRRVLVAAPDGTQVPLGQLADVTVTTAPPTIHDENGALAAFVFVDVAGRDLGGYVTEAKRTVAARVPLPPGYHLAWAGQFEYLERARARLLLVVPATLLIVFVLLYLNTKSVTKTMIVLLAVPFSAVGAVWLLWLLGYNTSIAVWVGLVALLGVDAETGVFMLLYLDLAWSERVRRGRMQTAADLHDAIVEGAVQRLRPKVMTVGVMIMGLLPIMWSHGTGADVMKRIAAPMVGGIVTSFLMELLVYPAIYALWRERSLERPSGSVESSAPA
jgi:Cu(I)/Ag(I) efflux system membrane protein CusA/SilA